MWARNLLIPCLAIAALGTSSCASFGASKTKLSYAEGQAMLKASPDRAVVMFYSRSHAGATVVDENSTCLALVAGYEVWPAAMMPGRHSLVFLLGKDTSKAIAVELAAGKTYVIRVDPEPSGGASPTPIKISERQYWQIDGDIYQRDIMQPVPEKCAKRLASGYTPELIEKTRATVANGAPSLLPDDGFEYRGSFNNTKQARDDVLREKNGME
jgi:hypothetical protein